MAEQVKAQPLTKNAFFENHVAPLFAKHCYKCHSHQADEAEGSLMLDSRSGWMIGGDSGPALIPGSPEKSLLMRAVEYRDDALQMPPAGKLAKEQIAILRKWIAQGAYDPRVKESAGGLGHGDDGSARLWSLEPIEHSTPPSVKQHAWPANPIDQFILRKLEAAGLRPAQKANRYALLRRATFDLTGLPPTPEEIRAFLESDSPDAFGRAVDRLLASPHYGERWGRHWLDLARFADSNGADINYAYANAWRYRDYVVRAFNIDKPYDRFIHEQLAGDLLVCNDDEQRNEALTATGFLMIGPKMLAEVDTDKLLIDIVDEQLDVVGQTFLGMTFGCARCHDHKFDPITTRDYYAMAGIFKSTKVISRLRPSNGVSEWLERDLANPVTAAEIRRHELKVAEIKQRIERLGGKPAAKSQQLEKKGAHRAVVVAGLPSLSSTTWAAWVRIHQPLNLDAVISATHAGADQGHSLGFHTGKTARHPRIVWNHGRGLHTIIVSPEPIALTEWHHVAATFDDQEKKLILYVDGKVKALRDNVSTTPFSTLNVGRREASKDWTFRGDVDEVVVFGRALSADEIMLLANEKEVNEGLVLRWSFEQIHDKTTIRDSSPGGHEGKLVGFTSGKQRLIAGRVGRGLSFGAGPLRMLQAELARMEASAPKAERVMAVAAATPIDLPIHVRGNHLRLADKPVPRGVPRVFAQTLEPAHIRSQDNGRLQLANWITDPRHPLTSRVMVNRLWHWHFGQGLVRTPSNYGARGDTPSHPKLLDWLAAEFVRSGWSIKHMHRLILTSSTYRQSSRRNAEAVIRDPENRLLARQNLRRLEAEAIRDALLSVSGSLDRGIGGSLLESPNYQRVSMGPRDPVYDKPRRSIYLPVIRVRGYHMFSIFDVVGSGQHLGRRPVTTVPQQALFMMNNPFVLRSSESLAERMRSEAKPSDTERLRALYLLMYGRPATEQETSTLLLNIAALRREIQAAGENEHSLWTHIVHMMIAANEFVYLR